MGSELEAPTKKKSYTEIFYDVFPFYLSIGMTYEQFWLSDPWLAKYYRDSYKIKNNRDNELAWLQGAYIYDAINTCLYNMFGRKNGQKAMSYVDKPFNLDGKQTNNEEDKELAEAQMDVWMHNFVNSYK